MDIINNLIEKFTFINIFYNVNIKYSFDSRIYICVINKKFYWFLMKQKKGKKKKNLRKKKSRNFYALFLSPWDTLSLIFQRRIFIHSKEEKLLIVINKLPIYPNDTVIKCNSLIRSKWNKIFMSMFMYPYNFWIIIL